MRPTQTFERESALARSAAIVCRNLVREQSGLLSLGRFEIVRTLGRGGHGTVYEAFDPLRGERIALKVLHGRGPSQLYHLKREFRSLAEQRHRNLVALHELSVEGQDAYFTMELIAGRDFVSYVRELPPSDAARRARDALAQLCEGIRALHCAGKLHRDIKPSNVLVASGGRVVLLDFGLACDASDEAPSAAGTRGYVAPEQARGATCESSDWYGFGRILSRTLDALGPARAELAGLAALAERLANDAPEARPDFAEIIAAVSRPSAPPPVAGLAPQRRSDAPWIGREGELARLHDALARSRRQPVMIVVRGEPGVGKSALVSTFCAASADPLRTPAGASPAGARPRLLRGRCHEREAVPYKALDDTIDALSHVLLELSDDHPARKLAIDAGALLHIFPVLGRVVWLERGGELEPAATPLELRARGLAALRALLIELALERPLIVCIDDLQWSDADSGWLLGALLCEELAPCVLIVATERAAASPAVDALARVSELAPRPLLVEELALGPLTLDESLVLAHSVSAGLSRAPAPEALARVAADARGNPRIVCELARAAGAGPREAPSEPLTLDELLELRLRELASSTRAILALVAAAGRPLATRTLVLAAQLGVECHVHIKALRAARLVRAVLHGHDEWLELEHERIGESVLGVLEPDARAELHARLVDALEAEAQDMSEALIEQYIGAGRPLDAARCARRAAEAAAAALAFTRAARLYEQALALGAADPAFDVKEQIALHQSRALALARSGQCLDAADAYRAAADLSTDRYESATLDQRAAEHWMRSGRPRHGEERLRRGYRTLGLAWPKGRAALVLAIAKLLLPAWLRSIGSRAAEPVSERLLRARARFLDDAGVGLECYDLMRGIYNALLCFAQAERLGDPVWSARVRGSRGIIRAAFAPGSWAATGLRQLEAASAEVAPLGDVSAHCTIEVQRAVAYFALDRPRSALEAAQRSEQLLRGSDDAISDRCTILAIIGSAQFDLGYLKDARRTWNALTYAARLHGDAMTMVWVHANPTQLAVLIADGERERSAAILERVARARAEHPSYPLVGWAHAAGCVEHAAFWATPAEALAILRREERVLFSPSVSVLRLKARMMRARACLRAAAALPPGGARAALLRCAVLDVLLIRMRGGAYNRGMASLLAAGIAAQRDRPAAAIARLDAAREWFDACEARLLSQAALYCKGRCWAVPRASSCSATPTQHSKNRASSTSRATSRGSPAASLPSRLSDEL